MNKDMTIMYVFDAMAEAGIMLFFIEKLLNAQCFMVSFGFGYTFGDKIQRGTFELNFKLNISQNSWSTSVSYVYICSIIIFYRINEILFRISIYSMKLQNSTIK